uniref:Transmembrane protein n=1 Tax=Panagrellus redivivus TaxID=6233 RepID=A0A7E4W9U5_PANRE
MDGANAGDAANAGTPLNYGADRMPTSAELLRDVEREANAMERAKKQEKGVTDEDNAEMNKFFWFFAYSTRKAATHLAIVFLFSDLLAITTASRNPYLVYQWLFVASVIGPPSLIFGVNVDAYYAFAFIISYVTCVLRFVINGIMVVVYYFALNTQRLKSEAYDAWIRDRDKRPSLNATMPVQDKRLFRSPITFYLIIAMCCLMALLQIWAVVAVIPRAHTWIRKRYGFAPVVPEKKE